MQRYNRTNFVTRTVAQNIVAAMSVALKDGLQHYVENKRGQRWLRVCIKPVEGSDSRFTFEFRAGNGQDVGHLIFQALFIWDRDLESEFSTLLAELYGFTKHPFWVAKQKALDEHRNMVKAQHKYHLSQLGVTHSFRTPAGSTYLGYWKRSWYGKRRFVAVADAKGVPFAKAFTLADECLLYGTVQGAF